MKVKDRSKTYFTSQVNTLIQNGIWFESGESKGWKKAGLICGAPEGVTSILPYIEEFSFRVLEIRNKENWK